MALRSQLSNVFAEENLKRCRSVLTNAFAVLKPTPKSDVVPPRKAAILIPLCLVNNKPSVLFARRPLWMRKHPGEIAFPGGGVDACDTSLAATALREAKEELGITLPSSSIIGTLPISFPNNDRTYLVTGIVAYIGQVHRPKDHIFPESVGPCHILRPHRGEVDDIYVVTIGKLVANEKTSKFRAIVNSRSGRPGVRVWTTPCYHVKSTENPPISVQIWGLTGLMIHQTLKVLLPALPTDWIVK